MEFTFYKEKYFKETPLGKIPEGWEVVKVEKVCKVVGGGTPSKKVKEYWNGKIPFVTPTDVTKLENKNANFLDTTESYITEKGLKNSSANLLPPGSVLLTSRATIGYCVINKVPVATNQGFANLICDEKVYNLYILYLMRFIRRRLEQLAAGSTFKEIARTIVRNLWISLPPLSEQRKIGEVLSAVDEAILKVNEVIAKTERLKKGLMQEILTKGIGHKEFKDTEIGRIPKEWEVVRLGDVLELCQYGLSIKMSGKGKYPIIRMDEIADGYVVSEITKYVNLDERTFRNFKLEKGDILFNRTNSYELVGRTGIFLLEGDYVFASYLIRLRPNREMVDPSFLTFYLILSNDRLRQLATRAVHQANINATNLKRFKIPLPSLQEQKEIASVLSTVYKKLRIERNEKRRLEKIKQGLMGLLLTGKIRVKVD
jgi:type I restriction enzyme S subunit